MKRIRQSFLTGLLAGVFILPSQASNYLQKKEAAELSSKEARAKRDYTLGKLYEAQAHCWQGAHDTGEQSKALLDLFLKAAELRASAVKAHISAADHLREANRLSAEISRVNSSSSRSVAVGHDSRPAEIRNLENFRQSSLRAHKEALALRDKLDRQAGDMKPLFDEEMRLLEQRKREYYPSAIKSKLCSEISEQMRRLAEKFAVDPVKRDYFVQKAGFYSRLAGVLKNSLVLHGFALKDSPVFELLLENRSAEQRRFVQKHFPKEERIFINQLMPAKFTEARYAEYLRKKDMKVTALSPELPRIRQRFETAGAGFSEINPKVSLYLQGCVGLCGQIHSLLREGATLRFFYEAKPRVFETLDLYYKYPSIRRELTDNCAKYYMDQKKADLCATKVAEIQKKMSRIRWWTMGKADKLAAAQKRFQIFSTLQQAFSRGDGKKIHEVLRQAQESDLLRDDKVLIASLIPPPILDFSIPAELMKLLEIAKKHERKIFKAVYGFELHFPNDEVVYYEKEEEL